jgi:TolB-like protein/predicted Ser/Thr protein kinase
VIAPLASGGMGQVYRARDRRLGRTVAIKVLASDTAPTPVALARLRREAEAASSLNHSAIVTIYDIGETEEVGLFIAMELVEGMNLRDWLRGGRSSQDKIETLLQVASGLSAAHARGILHRDIKPENIMVSREGLAKVVDFGLAKSVDTTASADSVTDLMITAQGRVVGTVAYMSPEQLRGEALDVRSDVFSYGCVLYEAFAGKPPFGKGSNETIGRILRDRFDALPGDIDPLLAHVIERCLEKDPAARYQTIGEVAAALKTPLQPYRSPATLWWAVGVAALVVLVSVVMIALRQRPSVPALQRSSASIAVLPFRALGSNAETYVADGISDALTTDLAKQSNLTVIARNSTQHFNSDGDLHRAAEELRARYLLLGSVQRVEQNVRIDARLVDATTEAHVWAEHYERPLSEIFSAEEAIVRAVAGKIAPQAAAPRALPQPSDPRVADLYLRARFFAEDPIWVTQDRSIPLLEQVVQLDPGFLPARIALANQYHRKAFQPDPDRKWEEKGFVELQKILAQDPSAPAAYMIRANLHWNLAHHFPHEETLADLDRAIQLDPNLVPAYNSRGSVLMHVGLLDEALRDFHHALRLDPFNDFAGYRVARIHLYQQKCAEAASEFKKSWPGDFQFPIALECSGASDAALAALSRLDVNQAASRSRSDRVGNEADVASTTAVVFAKHGRSREAQQAIQKVIAKDNGGSHYHHAMYFIAAAYAQMHCAQDALKWLERTSREGMPCYPLFASDPLLDPIRSDPAIRKFLDTSRREWDERRRARRSNAG